MSKFSQILLAIILLLGGVVFIQYKHSARISDERDRYKQNNTALLSDIERMQIDSTTMAVDAKAIHQTISSDNPYVDIKYSQYIQIDKK